MKIIYLASPYSHPDERVRTRRYIATREFVYDRLNAGFAVVSPIVYCHQFARDFSAPTDAKAWLHLNQELLLRCEEVWVLKLQGWDESVGVLGEISTAKFLGLPLHYHEPLSHANF